MKRTVGKDTPSEREMELMSLLWDRRAATVLELQEELNELYEPEVGYTTVLSQLQSLRAKGWVRVEKEGRAYTHFPDVSREHARFWEVRRVVELFYDGKLEELLVDVLADKRVHEMALRRCRRLIVARLKALPPRLLTPPARR